MRKTSILILLALLLTSCQNSPLGNEQGDWIRGSEKEKLALTEKHFRGFDMAMVEVGYRYQELYWAGQDQNWEYAEYQLKKIKKATENGLERRPKRAKSAETFLSVTLPEMKKAINEHDTVVFKKSFKALTISCNSCHVMEKVPSFIVKRPLSRVSAIRK